MCRESFPKGESRFVELTIDTDHHRGLGTGVGGRMTIDGEDKPMANVFILWTKSHKIFLHFYSLLEFIKLKKLGTISKNLQVLFLISQHVESFYS